MIILIHDGGKVYYLPKNKVIYENGKVRKNDTLTTEGAEPIIYKKGEKNENKDRSENDSSQ